MFQKIIRSSSFDFWFLIKLPRFGIKVEFSGILLDIHLSGRLWKRIFQPKLLHKKFIHKVLWEYDRQTYFFKKLCSIMDRNYPYNKMLLISWPSKHQKSFIERSFCFWILPAIAFLSLQDTYFKTIQTNRKKNQMQKSFVLKRFFMALCGVFPFKLFYVVRFFLLRKINCVLLTILQRNVHSNHLKVVRTILYTSKLSYLSNPVSFRRRYPRNLSNYNKWLVETCHEKFLKRFGMIIQTWPWFGRSKPRHSLLHKVSFASC